MKLSESIRVSVAALAAVVAAAGGVARAADGLTPAIETVGGARATRPPGAWFVSAGARVSLLRSAGFDPFSTNDALAQFSATALRAFATGPALATAVGLQWEGGSADAQARGADAHLSLTRAALVLEERYVPRPWAYAFARVAPGIVFGEARLDDLATPARLESSFSAFGLDASGGLAGRLNPGPHPVGVWVVAEGGYGWSGSRALSLAPALPASDRDKSGVTPFGDISASGAFFRFAVALDY
jgi:hypothetical protein